jgi:hypothetical protein
MWKELYRLQLDIKKIMQENDPVFFYLRNFLLSFTAIILFSLFAYYTSLPFQTIYYCIYMIFLGTVVCSRVIKRDRLIAYLVFIIISTISVTYNSYIPFFLKNIIYCIVFFLSLLKKYDFIKLVLIPIILNTAWYGKILIPTESLVSLYTGMISIGLVYIFIYFLFGIEFEKLIDNYLQILLTRFYENLLESVDYYSSLNTLKKRDEVIQHSEIIFKRHSQLINNEKLLSSLQNIFSLIILSVDMLFKTIFYYQVMTRDKFLKDENIKKRIKEILYRIINNFQYIIKYGDIEFSNIILELNEDIEWLEQVIYQEYEMEKGNELIYEVLFLLISLKNIIIQIRQKIKIMPRIPREINEYR